MKLQYKPPGRDNNQDNMKENMLKAGFWWLKDVLQFSKMALSDTESAKKKSL